jgi:hypothetical protein
MGANIQGVFSKNRAEELGSDVWEQFVIPPFYDRLDLTTARKPRLIIGGRGCGKTMLLRYLSHQTMFSRLRPQIPISAIKHIGLYWRADTQFMNLMSGRGIEQSVWQTAFVHTAALALGVEVLSSLRSMAASSLAVVKDHDIDSLDFTKLRAFDSTLPVKLDALFDCLEIKVWEMQAWVNDVLKAPEPRFLAGEKFVGALIQEIKSQLPQLADANYFVYIDEYENLRLYQQTIINTWLKHSQTPLIFNLAIKRNAFETQSTTGPESLSNIHDYRIHDLELEIESDFPLFAAEILFLQLALARQDVPVDPQVLRDPARLNERKDPRYIHRVRTQASTLFPGVTQEQMAKSVFDSPSVLSKLRDRIKHALAAKGSQLEPDEFLKPGFPEASVVSPALIYRKNLSDFAILQELRKLEAGDSNDFTGTREWVHNNFIGSYLQLFEPHSRPCPFYAGFQAFCQLSHGNLRHLLELCHQSISRVDEWEPGQPVPIEIQADAAREASASFLREVRSCGPLGVQLYTFVLRLGSLFAIAHQRPTQSEPEQTHFSIGDGIGQLEQRDHVFLREAVKWSVLYEEEETKKKGGADPENVEYVLDPIYAPYFHISYRKRRKMKLKTDDVVVLIRGTYDQVKDLLKRYSVAWEVEPNDLAPTLFSHLGQE